jgi:Bacterial Ig domain
VLIAGGESVVGGPPNTTLLSSTELYSPSTVSITNPAADSTVSSTVPFTCTDTAPGAIVGLYIDDVYVAAGNSPFTFSWDTTSASNGNHYLVCNGYVNGSTNGSAAENVTVNNLTPPTPTISITNPPADSTVSATVPFSCTDTAPDATVILYIDDVYVAGGNSPLTFSWDTTAASNGSHYLVCNGYVNGSTNGSAAEDVTVSN